MLLARVRRAAQSFSAKEVTFMVHLFTTISRGGDVRDLRSRPEFVNLYRKVTMMKKRVDSGGYAAKPRKSRKRQ